MANFFDRIKNQLSEQQKKKRKIISGARKFMMAIRLLPIAIKIGLIFAVVSIVSGLIYSIFHWGTDMDSSQNNPSTLYDMIGAGDQNINELVSIAGNEEDGYYIAFKEGVETRLKEIIDKYSEANTQGIQDYTPENGEDVLSQDILLRMIKAELYTQYPNLGGKVGKESNVALLQDTKERYNQGVMQIPNIYQSDEESQHACVAMVLSYLKGESVTEDDVIKWASQDKYKGDYFYGDDGILKYFEESAKEWDVGDIMQIKSEQTVKDALKLGRPVIAYVNERTNDYFTKSKQYIVLTGIDDDGNVYVNNPDSNRQEGEFDFDKVISTIVEKYYIYHSKQGVEELKEAPDTKTKASNTRTATSTTKKTNSSTNSSNNNANNANNDNSNNGTSNNSNSNNNNNANNNNSTNNTSSQVKDLEGFLFVGDSITAGMESVADSGVTCKAVVGVGSQYWLDHFDELTGLPDIKGINVFLGANDYSYGIEQFKQLLDKLHEEYKDAKMYVNKLLPDLQPTADTAAREKYMEDVEAYCKEKSYLTYIDATDDVQLGTDGLHPAGEDEYKKLYENIKEAITKNGGDTSSSPVTTSENVKKARMFIAEDTGKGLDGFQGSVRIRRVTPNKELGKVQKVQTGETTVTETTSGESGGQINSYIEENITDGTWAVYAQNLSTNSELVNIDADKQLESASLIKLFIMAEAYQEMETDSTKQYDKTLIGRMIEESDNDATNTLIDQIGMDKINQYIKDNGYDKTCLNRKMLQVSSEGDNYTSAKDVAKILKEIYDGKCVSQQASSEMLGYLKNQKNTSKIPAGISDNVEIANKTGELTNIESDAAIVFKDGAPYVLVVISTGISDSDAAVKNITEISKRVYEKVDSGDLESSETNTKVSTTLESRIYDLKFMPQEKFDEWIESPDVDQKILEYYTLDKNWNIITAKWSYSSDEGFKFTKNTAVNYTNVIAKYTTPFEYLLDFYINIKDEEFILNFIKMAMDSQIVIAIQDNVTTTETTTTKTLHYNDGLVEHEDTTVKVTESVSTKVELTYADTWYVKVEKPSYPQELQGEKGWVDNVITFAPGKQKETTNTSTSTETGPSRQVKETIKVDGEDKTITRTIGSTRTITTSTYSISCTYDKEDEKVDLKEKDFVNLFNFNDVARNRLKDIWLLRMIENGKKTANFTDLTKYLLYQITHNELYGDISRESLLSKFKNNDFKSVSRNGKISYASIDISDEEMEMLYKITFAERGNGNQQQQEYVVSVILNRVLFSEFPNTVEEVIFQPGQFEPTSNSMYVNAVPTQTTRDAVQNVIENGGTAGFAVYFATPAAANYGGSASFFATLEYLFNDEDESKKDANIGGCHNFYTTENARQELAQYMTAGGGDFLEVALDVWTEVCTSGKFTTYGGASIPCTGPTIDCSAFVSWVMYEYGYDEFAGGQKWTGWWMDESDAMAQKYGWEVIEVAPGENAGDILEPGDIYVRHRGSSGHMDICVEVNGGEYLAYDCGDTGAGWNGTDASPLHENYFLTDSSQNRPGKIFRVTKP